MRYNPLIYNELPPPPFEILIKNYLENGHFCITFAGKSNI